MFPIPAVGHDELGRFVLSNQHPRLRLSITELINPSGRHTGKPLYRRQSPRSADASPYPPIRERGFTGKFYAIPCVAQGRRGLPDSVEGYAQIAFESDHAFFEELTEINRRQTGSGAAAAGKRDPAAGRPVREIILPLEGAATVPGYPPA